MSHAIEFIETPIFTKQIKSIATDEELRRLQIELIAQPEKGKLIKGTGGLRKVRLATGAQGKQGSARIIYLLATPEKIFFLLAYAKSHKDTLTADEKQVLKLLAEQLKNEVQK